MFELLLRYHTTFAFIKNFQDTTYNSIMYSQTAIHEELIKFVEILIQGLLELHSVNLAASTTNWFENLFSKGLCLFFWDSGIVVFASLENGLDQIRFWKCSRVHIFAMTKDLLVKTFSDWIRNFRIQYFKFWLLH